MHYYSSIDNNNDDQTNLPCSVLLLFHNMDSVYIESTFFTMLGELCTVHMYSPRWLTLVGHSAHVLPSMINTGGTQNVYCNDYINNENIYDQFIWFKRILFHLT